MDFVFIDFNTKNIFINTKQTTHSKLTTSNPTFGAHARIYASVILCIKHHTS